MTIKRWQLVLIQLIILLFTTYSCDDNEVIKKNIIENNQNEVKEVTESINLNLDSLKTRPKIDFDKYRQTSLRFDKNDSIGRSATQNEISILEESLDKSVVNR